MKSILLIGLILLSLVLVPRTAMDEVPQPVVSTPKPTLVAQVIRPKYRLSLISGGVSDLAELRAKVEADPILAKFYHNFDFDKARLITLDKDVEVYMSFRVGSQIRWTKKKVKVKAGEQAVTDGKLTILLRCGNMIAWSPQGTMDYPAEPLPPDLLEVPIQPSTEDQPMPDLVLTDFDTPVHDVPEFVPTGSYAPISTPFIVPVGGFAPVVPPAPAPTPEPASSSLFVIGLVATGLKAGKKVR